jgi:thymidylate synthase (FAD)
MEHKILDHGYLNLVEGWGSDERIVEAARMSTQKGFIGWGPLDCPECMHEGGEGRTKNECRKCSNTGVVSGDEKLLRYLWENAHHTPFEMAGATFEVQAPIFVFREWHRHRVPFGYNEASARYSPLPDLNYVPTVERLMANAGGGNRQVGTIVGSAALTKEAAEKFRFALRVVYDGQQALYEDALAWGVSKELARIHLPVGRYSRMRATANLRGWLSLLKLRDADATQWEFRQYARAVRTELEALFPRTMALFNERRTS